MAFASIPEILDDLRAGRVIVLVDDESRENEGDFVVAAEFVTPEIVNFMTRVGGGYLCVAVDGETCDRLELGPQGAINTSLRQTPFTISIDGHPRHGVGTGISSSDRAITIRMMADPEARPDDFVRPGHINPLRARDGGVLVRTGQTEGSVDLCKLAGLKPASAIIEVVKPDGDMARLPDLEEMCVEHGLKMCSVEQIIEHRLAEEAMVERIDPVAGRGIETPEGTFQLIAWRSSIDEISAHRGSAWVESASSVPTAGPSSRTSRPWSASSDATCSATSSGSRPATPIGAAATISWRAFARSARPGEAPSSTCVPSRATPRSPVPCTRSPDARRTSTPRISPAPTASGRRWCRWTSASWGSAARSARSRSLEAPAAHQPPATVADPARLRPRGGRERAAQL